MLRGLQNKCVMYQLIVMTLVLID